MKLTVAAVFAYLALIVGTNISFSHVGPVLITFVLAGLTLAARDFVSTTAGREVAVFLLLVGAGVSAFWAKPEVAFASGVAFLLAEALDLLVFEKVSARYGRIAGVALSGTVGSIVDSVVFLSIAFGSLAFLPAQLTGKIGATLGATALLAVVALVRRRRA